jgi:hypothetical protein
LANIPELGSLYLLQQAIEISTRALIAAHPVLASDERPHWVEKSAAAEAAERLIFQFGGIAKAAEEYVVAAGADVAEGPPREEF